MGDLLVLGVGYTASSTSIFALSFAAGATQRPVSSAFWRATLVNNFVAASLSPLRIASRKPLTTAFASCDGVAWAAAVATGVLDAAAGVALRRVIGGLAASEC